MKNLDLDRPLAVFDLETTGTDPATDRIVEISVLRIDLDGTREARTRRINPGIPIPPQASAVHNIRDEDVRDAPTFRRIARGLLAFLADADLAGFNILRFDLPLLEREFRDCGLELNRPRRRVVDAMTIFHRKERRDLGAAVRFFLGRELEGAHSAEADVAATADVLEAQLERYEDLPRNVADLDAWVRNVPRGAIDRAGKFVWEGDEAVFSFGRHRGKSLRQIAIEARDYLEWIVSTDFPPDACEMVRRALDGEFPTKDATQST